MAKRVLTNHCVSNVEASALRRAIAEEMGYDLRRTRRKSGSIRVRIDLPNAREGEKVVSAYIRAGKWKYVICESYDEAHDFQWYAIDQLKPILNKRLQPWEADRTHRYECLFNQLLTCQPLSCSGLRNKQSGPGVYVLFHEQEAIDFRKALELRGSRPPTLQVKQSK